MSASDLPSPFNELQLPPAELVPPPAPQPTKAKKVRIKKAGTKKVRAIRAERGSESEPSPSKPGREPSTQKTGRKPELVVGAQPRVDLLPPEVKAQRSLVALRDRLFIAVGVVAVVVLAGVGGAWYLTQQAQQELSMEQSRTPTLLAAQQRFKNVAALEAENDLWQTAQHVAGATEIDWQDYLMKVQQTLPEGVVIQSVKVDSETPLAAYAQPSTPLLGARVATITFTATSDRLPDVPRWLEALKTLKGYADANPDSVDLNTAEYSATITMHVNTGAFDDRFVAKEK